MEQVYPTHAAKQHPKHASEFVIQKEGRAKSHSPLVPNSSVIKYGYKLGDQKRQT